MADLNRKLIFSKSEVRPSSANAKRVPMIQVQLNMVLPKYLRGYIPRNLHASKKCHSTKNISQLKYFFGFCL